MAKVLFAEENKIVPTEMQKRTLSPGRMFLVIAKNEWAKASNYREAWRKCSMPSKYLVYDVPEDAIVTNDGFIEHSPMESPAVLLGWYGNKR